jgi:hypothetical protein
LTLCHATPFGQNTVQLSIKFTAYQNMRNKGTNAGPATSRE